jgi:PAS domain S-box-containing protein
MVELYTFFHREETHMRINIILILNLLFMFSVHPVVQAEKSLRPEHVLLLNSYDQRMTWVKDITIAVEDVLDPDNNNIILHIANMDSKQFHSPEYFDLYKKYLKQKYNKNKFSLILSSDNNAFDFLLKHRDELFPGVPVVFCGVNNFKDNLIKDSDKFTGVAELFSARKTVETALKLHPRTQEIFIINDYLETGRAWQKDIDSALSDLKEKVRITYSKDLAMDELQTTIANLNKNTIVLLGVYYTDKDGRFFTYEKVGAMISGASHVPVYCLLEFNMGKGVVGGEVISGYYQGKTMTEIGKRVLNGEDPNHIPVLKKGANRIIFDYLHLKRFGVAESSLPDGSVVINKPYSVFQKYKKEFITLTILIMALVVTIAALLLNILLRTRAEEALRESEQRLSTHLLNTPVGAILWDRGFKVIEWNPAAETIFGFTRKEAIGKHVTKLILPEDVKNVVDNVFQEILSSRGGEGNINENITKSGKRILCDWYNTILKDVDGNVTGVASLVNDITDLKRTQEMMIQSEKMLSIGGLAAGMAHEINNPLAGMMQNAQVIHNRLTKNLPANDNVAKELGISMAVIKKFMEKRDILKQLENIHQAGSRAAKVIENMLSFARKSDSVRSEHNLYELIDKTIELAQNDYSLKKKYDFKQIKIIRKYNPDIPKILCEASKIQQVLFNLIKNASESMGLEKRENKAHQLILRLQKAQKMVCIEIEDNGPGMDPATRKRVFEPFFTTKSVDKGTGLGLSVSYFIIVDDHGGEMEVESTLGKGTKFIIKLPIQKKE